jgi:mannose-1-phosphate guanylyltransferase
MINLILCGGSGTRLWPLSRKKLPKQYVKLFGGRSLFEENLIRNAALCDRVMVATNIEHLPIIEEQLQGQGIGEVGGLIEPVGRNTAPAIALVLFNLQDGQHDDEVVLVTPSDHRIRNQAEYARAVQRAKELALQGYLVTFGIRPYYAETGYGYIESDGDQVLSFREKPDKPTAEGYLATGTYYWNSGMFVFQAKAFLKELAR